MASLKHPNLGLVQGKIGDGVVQFLGMKYAAIKDRFAPPELVESAEEVDATEFGPSCMSPPACDAEFGFIQQSLPKGELPSSDRDGLTINVTVPATEPPSGVKLPVFVFLHGGGFNIGSSAWPQYDFARFVKLSAEKGLPVIGVSLNYRLGLPGFLTSEEMRKAGYKANNGLRDQRAALLWIKKHIAGFGGDSENVTLSGESAGSAAATYHLQSEEPLFKRLMLLSGSSLLMKALPAPVHEFFYTSALESLGIQQLSAEERVNALRTLPVDDILAKIPPTHPVMPMVDGDIIKCVPTFEQIANLDSAKDLQLPGKDWCKAILVGDCQFDAHIMFFMLAHKKPGISQNLPASLYKSFSDNIPAIEDLLTVYGLPPNVSNTTDDAAFLSFLHLTNDIGFYAPTITMATGFSKTSSAHVYFFNAKNPWDGPFKGFATHILDAAYLFQNYNDLLPLDQKAVAEAYASDAIDFAHGKPSWPAFSVEKPVERVYGSSSDGETVPAKVIEGLHTKESERRDFIFKIADKVGLDRLSGAWDAFMAGN